MSRLMENKTTDWPRARQCAEQRPGCFRWVFVSFLDGFTRFCLRFLGFFRVFIGVFVGFYSIGFLVFLPGFA